MDERIDLLDAAGNPTGGVVYKSEAHRRGLWHRCFQCWIFGSDTTMGPYLLAQRRAAAKDTWPGYLDVTAAGHLSAGEETLDGLREVEEELGLSVAPQRLVPLGTRRVELEIPAGLDREFHDVFLLRDDTPPERLRLQREEVASVIRIGLDDAARLRAGDPALAREYPWRGEPHDTWVAPGDFVPHEDHYLGLVADAARRALAGERVDRLF
jgi:isopentenyldiphosphate isomerase